MNGVKLLVPEKHMMIRWLLLCTLNAVIAYRGTQSEYRHIRTGSQGKPALPSALTDGGIGLQPIQVD
jgi:hypothetical protein